MSLRLKHHKQIRGLMRETIQNIENGPDLANQNTQTVQNPIQIFVLYSVIKSSLFFRL